MSVPVPPPTYSVGIDHFTLQLTQSLDISCNEAYAQTVRNEAENVLDSMTRTASSSSSSSLSLSDCDLRPVTVWNVTLNQQACDPTRNHTVIIYGGTLFVVDNNDINYNDREGIHNPFLHQGAQQQVQPWQFRNCLDLAMNSDELVDAIQSQFVFVTSVNFQVLPMPSQTPSRSPIPSYSPSPTLRPQHSNPPSLSLRVTPPPSSPSSPLSSRPSPSLVISQSSNLPTEIPALSLPVTTTPTISPLQHKYHQNPQGIVASPSEEDSSTITSRMPTVSTRPTQQTIPSTDRSSVLTNSSRGGNNDDHNNNLPFAAWLAILLGGILVLLGIARWLWSRKPVRNHSTIMAASRGTTAWDGWTFSPGDYDRGPESAEPVFHSRGTGTTTSAAAGRELPELEVPSTDPSAISPTQRRKGHGWSIFKGTTDGNSGVSSCTWSLGDSAADSPHNARPGPALRPVSTVALARGDVEVFGNEYSPSLVTPLPPLWSSSIGSPSPDDDGYDCYAGSSVQGGAASSAATPGERYVQSLASGHWFVDDGISALEDPSFLDDLSMYMEEKEEEEERGLAVPNSKLSQP